MAPSITSLRHTLSLILHLYKDYPSFIPNNSNTLHELFDMINEIEYVKCNNTHYSYTYDTMCQDVSNNYSWNKLPTELILMVISYVYKLEIIILNNLGEYENKINTAIGQTRQVYLGHVQEAHYFPVIPTAEGNGCFPDNVQPIFYTQCNIKLKHWADPEGLPPGRP